MNLSSKDLSSHLPMATPHAKETSPLRDDHHDYSQDFEDSISSSGCGGCFSGLFRWRRGDGNEGYLLQTGEVKESWLKKKAKKLKEISEILAGPKWKNFIRRFSIYGINKKKRSMMGQQFQYDIQSYELNFDEGVHKEVDAGFPDFSARFAASSGINKG